MKQKVDLRNQSINDEVPEVTVKDRYYIIYLVCFLLGISTLLPYNCFIIANQYFKFKFRLINANSSIESNGTTHLQNMFVNYVNVSSNVSTVIAIFWQTLWGFKLKMNLRIYLCGIVIFSLFLLTTIFAEINTDEWQMVFFGITLVSVILINANAAVYGTSIFGFVSTFPGLYTQAVCLGQVAAGLFASVVQTITILFIPDPIKSGLVFFSIACVVILLSLFSYSYIQKNEFVKFYRTINKVKLTINDDISDENEPLINTNNNVTSKKLDLKVTFQTFKDAWFYLTTTYFIFAITYSVFPALLTSVKSMAHENTRYSRDFFIPLMFVAQNIGDFISRLIGGWYPLPVNKRKAVAFLAYSRVLLIPLVMFCNIQPRHSSNKMVLFGDVVYYIISTLVGLTNGYVCTVCLMHIPKLVDAARSELISSMAQFFLITGILSGSLIGLLITTVI